MNAQQIFDTVARHLFTQGERAGQKNELGNFKCLYRGPNGTSCAVGCLITDAEYVPEMDQSFKEGGTTVDALLKRGLLPDHLIPHQLLLRNLQSVHDETHHWDFTDRMRSALGNVARRYDLDASVLSTLSFSNR